MAWWKWALVLALMFIGLWETFTKNGAIEQTIEMFLEDPVRGTFLTLERWVIWEALTPVFPIGVTSGGNVIMLFWYSLWDTFILAGAGVIFILLMKAGGWWPQGMKRWVILGIFLIFVWFISKSIWHAMWINNNQAMYGLSPQESDDMLLATSGMGVGLIGLMNLMVSCLVLPLLFKIVEKVG